MENEMEDKFSKTKKKKKVRIYCKSNTGLSKKDEDGRENMSHSFTVTGF